MAPATRRRSPRTTVTRKPTAERREEIVRAVLRIVGTQGVTALSTATLAREVRVTSGALFRHFPTLDAILDETVEYGIARIDDTFPDPALPPLERLLELARNRIRLLGSDPGLAWLFRSDQAYLSLPPRAVDRLRQVVRRSRAFLLDALREGARQGTIRSDLEPELLLVPVMGTIQVLIGMEGVHRQARGERPSTERALEALRALLSSASAADGRRSPSAETN